MPDRNAEQQEESGAAFGRSIEAGSSEGTGAFAPNHLQLLTRQEVEEVFAISKRYLETSGTQKNGPRFVRVGRSIRYRMQDIIDWIDANTEQPGQYPG